MTYAVQDVTRDVAEPSPGNAFFAALRPAWFLWLGAAVLVVPTLVFLARQIWVHEQGSHGPIVLATGIWLVNSRRRDIAAVARPGSPLLTGIAFVGALLAYIFARAVGWLGVECLAAYGALLAVAYYHVGFRAMRLMWFPILYFLFMFPEPEVITLPLSRALKLGISSAAIDLLSRFGLEIARGGVVIYIDQYQLLVAQACSGLNSLMGLSAIGVFYAYIRHDGHWRASIPLLLAIPVIAIAANFLRVVILVLITHFFGDAMGQGFVHDFAGLFMFTVAMLLVLAADALITRVRRRLGSATA